MADCNSNNITEYKKRITAEQKRNAAEYIYATEYHRVRHRVAQSTKKHHENTVKHCGTKKEINVTEYHRVRKNTVRHCENTVRHCGIIKKHC